MRSIIAALAIAAMAAAFSLQAEPSAARPADPNFVQVQMICTKSGERVSGMNKICSYDCAGSEATQTVGSTDLCPINMRTRNTGGSAGDQGQRNRGGMCVKTGERVSGLNKICSYNCGGSGRETTVSSAQLCPISPR